jgi:hypothetical protein
MSVKITVHITQYIHTISNDNREELELNGELMLCGI